MTPQDAQLQATIWQAERMGWNTLELPGLWRLDRPIILTRESSIRRIVGSGVTEETTSRTKPRAGIVYSGEGAAIRLGESYDATRERGMIGVSIEGLQVEATHFAGSCIDAHHCPNLSLSRCLFSGYGKDGGSTLVYLNTCYSSRLQDVRIVLGGTGIVLRDSHHVVCDQVNLGSLCIGCELYGCDHTRIRDMQAQSIDAVALSISRSQWCSIDGFRTEGTTRLPTICVYGQEQMTGWLSIRNAAINGLRSTGVVQRLRLDHCRIGSLATDSHPSCKEWTAVGCEIGSMLGRVQDFREVNSY